MSPNSGFQALVVGVGNYQYYTDLLDTLTDAQTFYNLLVNPKRCGYLPARVRLLTGDSATGDNILTSLAWLAHNATPEATTLIYFSGHGGYIDNGSSYLCPHEADWRDLAGTAIAAQTFSDALAAIHTPRLVVILDACYSGGMTALKGIKGNVPPPEWKGGLPRKYYEQLAQGEGRVVMASSRADQESLTLPEAKLSLFTHYLIKGIEGGAAYQKDGMIYVLDLFAYTSTIIRKERPLQDPILAAQRATNFPIALHQGGFFHKGPEPAPPGEMIGLVTSSLREIRKQIESPYTQTRLAGAQALLDYVKQLPPEVQQDCNADPIDILTQITSLRTVERDAEVFGETPQTTAQRLRILRNFFTIIASLERATGDSTD